MSEEVSLCSARAPRVASYRQISCAARRQGTRLPMEDDLAPVQGMAQRIMASGAHPEDSAPENRIAAFNRLASLKRAGSRVMT